MAARKKKATRKKTAPRKLKPPPPKNLWDRQPGESDVMWEAFLVYRELRLKRSKEKVRKKLGKSYDLVWRWSQKHDWRARVEAHDAYLDQQAKAAEVREIKRMNARHVRAAQKLQALALIELNKLIRNAARVKDNSEISADHASKIMDCAAKLERTSRGEPSDYTKQKTETDSVDLDKRIAQLLKARKK